jgi:hypothetical protein
MDTWYLFLDNQRGTRPSIIRRCETARKQTAARVFAVRLNTIAKSETYSAAELLEAIKREDELTDTELQWIATEPPEVLEV